MFIAILLSEKLCSHSKLHEHVKFEYVSCGDIDTLLHEEWTIQQQNQSKTRRFLSFSLIVHDSLEEKHPTCQLGYFETVIDISCLISTYYRC